MRDGPLFFMCDAHLGAGARSEESARESRLHEFLNGLPDQASHLYIIGDLFDFWFEYRNAIPRRHFATLTVLKRLRDAGLPITYLNGNHDFWFGSFLTEDIGVAVHHGGLPIAAQGRRLWIHHGDGLIGGDLGYRLLKQVLRNPVSVALYGLLHPDLGLPLAHQVSLLSRRLRVEKPLEGDKLWREIGEPRFAEGYDAVLIGHFHQVFERRQNGRELFVLGDWITRGTYAVLDGGTIRLENWPGGAD